METDGRKRAEEARGMKVRGTVKVESSCGLGESVRAKARRERETERETDLSNKLSSRLPADDPLAAIRDDRVRQPNGTECCCTSSPAEARTNRQCRRNGLTNFDAGDGRFDGDEAEDLWMSEVRSVQEGQQERKKTK
jgi:hypothetical protein